LMTIMALVGHRFRPANHAKRKTEANRISDPIRPGIALSLQDGSPIMTIVHP